MRTVPLAGVVSLDGERDVDVVQAGAVGVAGRAEGGGYTHALLHHTRAYLHHAVPASTRVVGAWVSARTAPGQRAGSTQYARGRRVGQRADSTQGARARPHAQQGAWRRHPLGAMAR